MRVLLSIKPEFIEKIASGEKKYEFRKVEFRQEVQEILVYATAPISMVVGVITPQKVIVRPPEELWKEVEEYSGITKEFYDEYYFNKKQAVAIKIAKYHQFKEHQELKKYRVKVAPQSFVYVE
jgi:predicted transcriptional regulator